MPFPITPVPIYPDVPIAAGVPQVFRAAAAFAAPFGGEVQLAVADAFGVMGLFAGPQWGVFTEDGEPVVIADSVFAVDFRREWRIADYQIEEGGFESYDKVQTPFDVRVRFAVSNTVDSFAGIQSKRAAFLQDIDDAGDSLELYTVVTPDATYPSVSIVHYDYRRDVRGGGPGMMLVDVWLEQLRITAAPAFAKSGDATKTAEGEAPANGGTVQPREPGTAGQGWNIDFLHRSQELEQQ